MPRFRRVGKMETLKKKSGKSDYGQGKLRFYEHIICETLIPSYFTAIIFLKKYWPVYSTVFQGKHGELRPSSHYVHVTFLLLFLGLKKISKIFINW